MSRNSSVTRVSTAEQGQSGLSLETQRHAVSEYINRVSVTLSLNSLRSRAAVGMTALNSKPHDLCTKRRATLIIAKLDRLARNVAFISTLMESGIAFIAADNPHANKLMIHMLAVFAEHERDQIRARTKAALAPAKARGVVLGRYGREFAIKAESR